MRKRKGVFKKAIALALAGIITFAEGTAYGSFEMGTTEVSAAEETTIITSMDYYDPAQANMTMSGVGSATFGIVLPKFNGLPSQELSLGMVEGDLELQVWQAEGTNGQYVDIDSVTDIFAFNSTWGWEHQVWSDTADGWIAWFKVTETTKIRFHGITNNVNLEYTFNFTELPKLNLTSIASTEPNKTASPTGDTGIDKSLFIFNGDANIKYDQVGDHIEILVKRKTESEFVPLLDNAASGWIWDNNFGVYTDGNGGWWFKEPCDYTVRFQHKDNASVYADVNIDWQEPDRSSGVLTAFEGKTVLNANDAPNNSADIWIGLPNVNGTTAVKSDLDLFTYEICVGATYNADTNTWSNTNNWVSLADVASSGWIYQANGYNKWSDKQQWGYDVGYYYGLWFKPVKENTYLRIGYPRNAQAGGAIDGNYVYYTFIGNPNAVIPDVSDMVDIPYDETRGNPTDDNVTEDEADANTPEGWDMIWHDEFNGNTINSSNWSHQTGFLLDENDIGTAGWGNNELEHYTDSEENSKVVNGALNITMLNDPKTFEDTKGNTATALYSSGKLISKDKFSVKYGRVDFRAKLPDGVGIWPALWMMPQDDVYGTWASSGEIDIMEGRGRTPDIAFATLHFGGQWPDNKSQGDIINMTNDGNVKSDMTDWHIYSVIWEEGNIKFYADGKCYVKVTNEQWYSNGGNGNVNAPFDQRFYLIMNLAAGGWFDENRVPADSFEQADMYVDYVRVYQKEVESGADEKNDDASWASDGTDDGLYGDYKLGERTAVEGVSLDQTSLELTEGETATLEATVAPSGASNKSVTWKSSNDAIAKVENGEVTAVSAGTATITVTTADGGKTATCSVKVNAKAPGTTSVTGVTLSKTTLTLAKGATATLQANVAPTEATNKNVTWSSEDNSIATVINGTVTAVSAGTTEIKVKTADGGFEAKCTVTVTSGVTGVSLNKESITLNEGDTETLTATIEPADASNQNLTWTSVDADIATVVNGKVTAVSAGTTTIAVTTEDGGYTAMCTVTVKAPVESVTVTPDTVEIEVGRSEKLTAEIAPANATNKNVIWNTSDESKATVDANGVVKGIAPGAVTITATTEDGNKTDFCTVSVVERKEDCIYVTGVTMNPTTLTMVAGDTYKLTATVAPSDATHPEVYWESSEPDVAYVGNDGTVRAWGEGEATITATTADGYFTATCKVTVSGTSVNGITVTPQILSLVEGETGVITATVTPSNAVNDDITWESSDNTIATVDANGVVTAKKKGQVFVTATTVDGGFTARTAVVVSAKAEEAVKVTGVTLNKNMTSLYVGGTETLTATVAPAEADDKSVVWTTSDSNTVFVESNGTIHARKVGTAVVTVTTTDGNYSATCVVNVAAVPVTNYTVSFNSNGGSAVAAQTVAAGGVAIMPQAPVKAGYTFKGWYYNNVAYTFGTAVNQNIVLTALWEPVVVKVTSISLKGISKKIAAGKKIQLTATVAPTNATNQSIRWVSSNTKYATVSATGRVTTKKAGKNKSVTITAYANDGSGVYATYKIKIMPKAVKKIKLKAASTTVKAGKKVKIKATVTPNLSTKKINKTLSWTTSNKKWATVTKKGVVMTKKAGKGKTVKITAKATDGSNKKKVIKIRIK